jgi:hypothetical protein
MTIINLRRTCGRELWTLRETNLEENGSGEAKTPEVLKKTTTIIFGWTCGSDRWTSGENTTDDSERGEAKLPKPEFLK